MVMFLCSKKGADNIITGTIGNLIVKQEHFKNKISGDHDFILKGVDVSRKKS